MWTIAADDVGQAAESFGHDPHADAWSLIGIEWLVIDIRHAGHDQGAGGTDRGLKGID